MEKMLVNPIFINKNCQPSIGDFCTSVRYPNKILIFGKFENSYPEECIKHEIILVSTKLQNKIKNGESYYDGHGNIRIFGTGNTYNIDASKIIAVQSQILKEDIIKIFIEKEIEIESEIYNDEIIPKLNEGYITIIYKENNFIKSEKEKSLEWFYSLSSAKGKILSEKYGFGTYVNLGEEQIEQIWQKEIQKIETLTPMEEYAFDILLSYIFYKGGGEEECDEAELWFNKNKLKYVGKK